MTQRVVLYNEDPSDPKGRQYVGSVIWRTEPITATGNQKPDIAVRADKAKAAPHNNSPRR